MSFHNSGIEEQTYNTLRAYMFGGESLGSWSKEELADRQGFIDWAVNECDWERDFDGEITETELREMCATVFDCEMEDYLQELEEEDVEVIE